MDRYDDVKFAKDEFEQLWKEAEGCEITAEDVKTALDQTYLKGDVTPYDLYIKMLMEYFSDRVMATDNDDPFICRKDIPNTTIKWMQSLRAIKN